MVKSPSLKPSSTASRHSSFFGKENGHAFFGNKGQPSFFNTVPVQAKLSVGQPGDKYEQEADSMADKVVQRMSEKNADVTNRNENTIQTKPVAPLTTITPLVQTKCATCEQEEKLQKKEEEVQESPRRLQRKPIFESNAEPPDDDEPIQRKCAACKREEKLQKAEEKDLPRKGPLELQLKPIFESNAEHPDDEKKVQRKCAECEKEEKLQKKQQDRYDIAMVQRKSLAEMSLNPDISHVQKKCAACEQEQKLLRKEAPATEETTSHSLENRLNNTRGSGYPLNHAISESMSNAFGSDFSGVRIHTDSSAVQLSKELHAQAFTHGNDIYFNSGKYDTNSTAGKQLLAHELTHTIQQGASKPVEPSNSPGINKSAGNNSGSKAAKDQVQRAYLRDSTMEICHRVLRSQTFRSANGSVSVKFRPRLSDPANPDCEHHKFYAYLSYSVGPFTFDTDAVEFDSSRPGITGWILVPDGDCYITIFRNYDNPNCCLLGDVVITDTVLVDCEEMRHNNQFPSQNGGVWDWNGTGTDGTYGPGPRLDGPLPVYQRDPGIPSEAKCRGACGPNCDTCQSYPSVIYHDITTGESWLYTNWQDCNEHEGCRQHDAAFDWAAAEHGEKGRFAPIMRWHMAANYECLCNYNLGQCNGWIKGMPPHTGKLYFADKAEKLTGARAQTDCKEQNPDFTNCTDEGADRDEVLVLWGMANGYEDFSDCAPHRNFPAGIIQACDLGPGRTWHCSAVDSDTGEEVTISIFECYCCNDTGASGSDWRSPHLSVRISLDVASSRGAPIISQDAFNKAQNQIQAGRFAAALDIVVADLVAAGRMNRALFTIRYVNRNGDGEGMTDTDHSLDPSSGNYLPDGPSRVEIYNPAFKNVQLLISTIMHEYQHVLQAQRALTADEYEDTTGEHLEADEVEAYLWEMEHSDETGMAAQIWNMRDIFERLDDHYTALGGINPARQATYRDRYDAASQYMRDLQAAPPPLPGYAHVFHHGSDYDTVEILRTADITATGGVDFGRGFYVHTKGNWRLAREWAIRHSLGKKGWGVITFPVPDRPWSEDIHDQLIFRNTRSRPRNTPINPDTGKQFKDWKEFVDYNKRKGRQGKLPDWSEFDVIEGPLWGRLSRTPHIHQVMFTGSGVGVLNRPDVKPLRIMRRWLFLRYR